MTFVNDDNEVLEVDEDIAMSKKGISFFDGTINGDVSLNFKVNNNSENRKVLNYEGPQMLNQVAWVKQPFNLMRNGNVFVRGYIVVQSDDEKTLNCFFVSGNSNWIQLLNGLISDLDWSGYKTLMDPNITGTMFPAGFVPVKTSGIVFPWVDWSYGYKSGYSVKYMWGYDGIPRFDYTVDSSNSIEKSFVDFYPCLFMSTLVNEIFQQNGLKLAGNIVNDQLFKTMIVPPVNGQMKRIPFKDVIAIGSSQVIAATPTKYINYTTIRDNDSQFTSSNGRFVASQSQLYYFKVTCTALSTPTAVIDFYVDGVFTGTVTLSPGFSYTFAYPIPKGSRAEIFVSTVCTVTLNLTISTPKIILNGDYVDPSNFLPKLTCISIVKFLVNFFGCQTYFDEYSKTVTMNIVEKMKPSLAQDWSEYFVSLRTEYTVNRAQNNYIRMEQPDEQEINLKNYNALNTKQYGEGVITTGNTLKDQLDIAKIPFGPSEFDIGLDGVWQTKVPLINLIDAGDPIPYTAITDLGSVGSITNFIRYTVGLQLNLHEVIRIVDNNGVNLGYFQTQAVGATTFDVPAQFVSNHAGIIYRQAISFKDIKPRILICKSNTLFSDFASSLGGATPWNKTNGWLLMITNGSNKGAVVKTNVDYAYYCKNNTGEPIDTIVSNLAFDNPDIVDFKNPSVKQLYLNKISQFLENPDFRFQMNLPEATFQSFDFSFFIQIKTPKITGYFFVTSIVNYKNVNTPVEVNVYML